MKIINIIVLLYTVFSIMQAAWSFNLETVKDGYPSFWGIEDIPVKYYVNSRGTEDIDGEREFQIIQYAFSVWEKPECSYISFQYAGKTDNETVGYNPESDNNMNLIIFRDSSWVYDPAVIALTTVTAVSESSKNFVGQILDADIELNDIGYSFSDDPSTGTGTIHLMSVLVHEIGHLVGLDHNPDNPDSTMYPDLTYNDDSASSLSDDDIDGLCFLYPDMYKPEKNYDITFQLIDQRVVNGCSMQKPDNLVAIFVFCNILLLIFRRFWRRLYE